MSEYGQGFREGYGTGWEDAGGDGSRDIQRRFGAEVITPKPKRKLSAWNKYVKANANKPRFKYKSGAKKGKLNLKKMGVAFRKTPAGKKSKR